VRNRYRIRYRETAEYTFEFDDEMIPPSDAWLGRVSRLGVHLSAPTEKGATAEMLVKSRDLVAIEPAAPKVPTGWWLNEKDGIVYFRDSATGRDVPIYGAPQMAPPFDPLALAPISEPRDPAPMAETARYFIRYYLDGEEHELTVPSLADAEVTAKALRKQWASAIGPIEVFVGRVEDRKATNRKHGAW